MKGDNMTINKKCSTCKYNIGCNYFEPFCDLAEMPIYDEKDCPIIKQSKNNNKIENTDRSWKCFAQLTDIFFSAMIAVRLRNIFQLSRQENTAGQWRKITEIVTARSVRRAIEIQGEMVYDVVNHKKWWNFEFHHLKPFQTRKKYFYL